ncbi:MAG TPA: DUF2231 domain-containing protein [Gemmatimonadales bacterium]|nr:DUF2231 domain-containing protein [Gemmatimonadales bacterium]
MLLLHGDGGGFLGYDIPRLHALLNDFPAALLATAVIFEILFLLTKRESLRIAAYWMLMAGVIGAGLAVLSGLGAEDRIAHGEAVHEIMEEHEELAFITTGIFAVVALWRLWRERVMSRGERMAALCLALVGSGFLVSTAQHGGELVFDHAAGIKTPALEEEIKSRAMGHQHEEGEEDDHDHDAPDSVSGPAPSQ